MTRPRRWRCRGHTRGRVGPSPPRPPAPREPPPPTLSASPDTEPGRRPGDHGDGAGLPDQRRARPRPVRAGPVGCDFSNLQVLDSGDTGGYTDHLLRAAPPHARRRRAGRLRGRRRTASSCRSTSPTLSTGAQTSITFDPHAPFAPPLRFRVAIDPTDTVRRRQGRRARHRNGALQPAGRTSARYFELDADLQAPHLPVVDVRRHRRARATRASRSCSARSTGSSATGAATLHIDAIGTSSTTYELIKHVPLTLVQTHLNGANPMRRPVRLISCLAIVGTLVAFAGGPGHRPTAPTVSATPNRKLADGQQVIGVGQRIRPRHRRWRSSSARPSAVSPDVCDLNTVSFTFTDADGAYADVPFTVSRHSERRHRLRAQRRLLHRHPGRPGGRPDGVDADQVRPQHPAAAAARGRGARRQDAEGQREGRRGVDAAR